MDQKSNSRSQKIVVLFIATLGSFFSSFMLSSINIAIPSISAEFSMNAVAINWISMSFILSSTILLVPFVKLADHFGYKKVFLIGNIIFTVIALATVFSTSDTMFLALRAIQGIGSAMVIVTNLVIVTYVFPQSERGKAYGIALAAVYLGISTGPFLGGLLTQFFGWRSLFIATIPFGLLLIITVIWKLKGEWTNRQAGKFDLAGSLIYMVSLLTLIYGLSLLPSLNGFLLITVAVICLIIFLWWENRVSNPVLEVKLFRKSRLFAFSNLAALFNYAATMAIAFLLSLYLQYIKGMSPSTAGLIIIASPIFQTILTPVAGRLSDRIDPRFLSSSGLGINSIGLIILLTVGQGTPLWVIITGLIIMGIGSALFVTPNTNAIVSSVEKHMYGIATATLSTMRQIGGMLAQAITMLMFALFIGKVEISPEYYPAFLSAMRMVFIISTVFCISGVFLSQARGKKITEMVK